MSKKFHEMKREKIVEHFEAEGKKDDFVFDLSHQALDMLKVNDIDVDEFTAWFKEAVGVNGGDVIAFLKSKGKFDKVKR